MIRKLIARFNKSVTKRVVSARLDFEAPISISFEPSRQTGKLSSPLENVSIKGVSKDLSESGIAFVVPLIRLKENYLVGENRMLNAELDLPNGKVKMIVVGQRYEQVIDRDSASVKYLIGAKIVQITEADKEIYEYFLRHNANFKKNSKAFNFGIDKG
ncbi:MAG: PilZ domain-containing protein [Acidobacteria bacterium]|nr:PilZ domain-containing protein [Acidobacteriota bacterium]MCA1637533.1 PilZ domain-containing protein [Acidobacteriota bacterium]